MATVFLAAGLQRYANGVDRVEIDAAAVRELIEELERRFPGLGEQLREGIAVAIDGDIVNEPMLEAVGATSEIHFLPPISGG